MLFCVWIPLGLLGFPRHDSTASLHQILSDRCSLEPDSFLHINQFQTRGSRLVHSQFTQQHQILFHLSTYKSLRLRDVFIPRQEAVTSADESWHFYGRLFSPRPSSHCSIRKLTGCRFAVNMPKFPFYGDGGGQGPFSSHGGGKKTKTKPSKTASPVVSRN